MLFCLKKFCSIVFLFNALSLSAQDFVSMPIPDSVWTKMQGKSYVPNPNIQRSDLRYLKVLHWDYDNQPHHGEIICNKLISNKFKSQQSLKKMIIFAKILFEHLLTLINLRI